MLETSENEEEKQTLETIKKTIESVSVETDEEVKRKMTDKEKLEKEKLEKEKLEALEADERKKLEEAEKEKKRLEEEAKKKDIDIDAKIKALEDKYEKTNAENKALEDKIKNLTESKVDLDKKLHEAEVNATIKDLEKEGIWPAVLEVARAIMLADGDTVKLFEVDDETKEKKPIDKSLEEGMLTLLRAIPKDARIDLSEKASSETSEKTKKRATVGEMNKMIKELEEKETIPYEEASARVAKQLEDEDRYPYE